MRHSLGATYRPNWMDAPPLLYRGNPVPARPGMVLFLHAIILDPGEMLAMSLGYTVIVGETGAEVLSKLGHEYVVCR